MFDTSQVTRRGGRERNEDAMGSLEIRGCACWVVADGLGGHHGGAVAAATAVAAVLAAFREMPEASRESVARYVARAQADVVAAQQRDPALRRMRATLVVLVADRERAVWGHVGDARLYRLEGGTSVHRTRDHSVTQALVDAGEIAPHEQARHADRDRLLRAIGQEDPVEAAMASEPLHRGDGFLLCSDGFWEALSELALDIDFAATASAREWLDRLEHRVVRRLRDDSDNYTALAVRVSTTATTLPAARAPQPAAVARPTQAPAGTAVASRDSETNQRDAPMPPRDAMTTSSRSMLTLVVAIVVVALVASWLFFRRPHVSVGTEAPESQAAQGGADIGVTSPGNDPVQPRGASGGTGAATGEGGTRGDEARPADPQALDPDTVYRVAAGIRYRSLGDALAAASPGDEIWLAAGTFATPSLRIDKEVHLRGAGRDRTTLDVSSGRGVVVTADAGSVLDLEICCAAEGPIIEIGGRFSGIVARARVRDGAGVGLVVRDAATPTIEDVAISGAAGGRMTIEGTAQPVLIRMSGS